MKIRLAVCTCVLLAHTSVVDAAWRTFWTYNSGDIDTYSLGGDILTWSNAPVPPSPSRTVRAQNGGHPLFTAFNSSNSNYGWKVLIGNNTMSLTSGGAILAYSHHNYTVKHSEFAGYSSASNTGFRNENFLKLGELYRYAFDVTVDDHNNPRWKPANGVNWFHVSQLWQVGVSPVFSIGICNDSKPGQWNGPSWVVRQQHGHAGNPAKLANITAPFEPNKTYRMTVIFRPGLGSNGYVSMSITNLSTNQTWLYDRTGESIYEFGQSGNALAGTAFESPMQKHGIYTNYATGGVWGSGLGATVTQDNWIFAIWE